MFSDPPCPRGRLERVPGAPVGPGAPVARADGCGGGGGGGGAAISGELEVVLK